MVLNAVVETTRRHNTPACGSTLLYLKILIEVACISGDLLEEAPNNRDLMKIMLCLWRN